MLTKPDMNFKLQIEYIYYLPYHDAEENICVHCGLFPDKTEN